MKLGDAFLMPHPHQAFDHLWFVISDPEKHGGTYIIANVTTDEFRASGECPLHPCDHNWITEKCFMNFADAMRINPEQNLHIQSLVGKVITIRRSLEPEVIARIVEAAKMSKSIPVGFKRFL
jgi:hypothetical protein